MIDYSEVEKIDIRIGKIISAEKLENEGYISHKLVIDFGSQLGRKTALVRLVNYQIKDLENTYVIGIVNVKPKKIKDMVSEVILLGTPDQSGECILITPEKQAIVGERVY